MPQSKFSLPLLAIVCMTAVIVATAFSFVATNSAYATEYRYISHRGIVNKKYPGNTIPAFKQAAATDGIYGIETDIWRTSDGGYVCIHGKGGKAIWNGHNVNSTKLKTLRSKKSNGYALPTLQEYLKICKSGGKVAVIEIKDKQLASNKKYAAQLAKIVYDAGMLKQCMIISFNAKAVYNVKKAAKSKYGVNVQTYALSLGSKKKAKQAADNALKYGLTGISAATNQLDWVYKNIFNQKKYKKLTLRGGGAWTMHDEKQARKVLENKSYNLFTVTVEFTPTKYKVTFKDPAGKVLKTQSVLYGANATAPSAPAVKGKTFTGWDKTYKNVKGNITVTAKYKANTYSIKYVMPSGVKTLTAPTTTSYTYGTALQLSDPSGTYTGYKFAGWYDSASGGKKITEISSSTVGDVVLYARYVANTYAIKYVLPSGSGLTAPNVSSYSYGTTTAIPNPSGKYAGHRFLGWYDSASGGKKISSISATSTGDIVLYSRFEEVIEWSADGTVGKSSSVKTGWKPVVSLTGVQNASYYHGVKDSTSGALVAVVETSSMPTYAYTGSALAPIVGITDGNGTFLKTTLSGGKITVTYLGNFGKGTAYALVKPDDGVHSDAFVCQFTIQ